MNDKIYEPILIYSKDTGELDKYDNLDDAEIDIESYDIDNYEAYDGKYKKLRLYKKDEYGSVGFEVKFPIVFCEDIIFEYICNEIKALYKTDKNKRSYLSYLIKLLPNKNL